MQSMQILLMLNPHKKGLIYLKIWHGSFSSFPTLQTLKPWHCKIQMNAGNQPEQGDQCQVFAVSGSYEFPFISHQPLGLWSPPSIRYIHVVQNLNIRSAILFTLVFLIGFVKPIKSRIQFLSHFSTIVACLVKKGQYKQTF